MPEARLMAALVILTGLLALFISLADEVLEGETHVFDAAILQALRRGDAGSPIGPAWMEQSMMDITAMGGFTVITLISLLSMGYLMLRKRWVSAGLIVVSGAGGTLLNHLLKTHFERPRPDLVSHLVEVSTLSFPSGHAMSSAIMYLTLGALLARSQSSRAIKTYILVSAIFVTALVGMSRVYLGVHWPTDVLAGWCLGATWAIACLLVVGLLNRYLTQK
ncbi:MAG: phosphoesterase [Pseudomonas fluorescens]|nr:MAG: phosphoesterase [Pseudomonas fluorescens]